MDYSHKLLVPGNDFRQLDLCNSLGFLLNQHSRSDVGE